MAAAAAQGADDTATTFSDMIKSSVTDNFVSDIRISKILITLGVAFLIGFFIYILYKRVFSGVLYSKSFNVSLMGMTMITATVIIAINSNLVLSLGMVGALSIVRFRTPIKDPTDLIFLFWAAVAGIVTGARFFTLAIIGSIIIGLILFLFIKRSSVETPYLLVINCDGDDSEREIHSHLTKSVKRYNMKQKTVTAGNIELTLELRLDDKEGGFVNTVSSLTGVKNALLISYSGDYVS
ncbi:membrane protein [Paenibacillus borealis]|uniref:Membrane protein n=1 Tax=Paenibacillus borealis TaxID=160799 RepID=A0A089MNG9_PAEBO|nr:membrane protein [Paenibacillus borealis]